MSLRKLCVFLFVNCIFIFRIANTFVVSYAMKYSEIFFVIRKFLAYTPPPPQLYMLSTALVFPITGSKSSNPITGHSASLNDFKIISCCSSPDELLIRESLLINKIKPSLNLQGSSVPLLLLLSIPLSIFVI